MVFVTIATPAAPTGIWDRFPAVLLHRSVAPVICSIRFAPDSEAPLASQTGTLAGPWDLPGTRGRRGKPRSAQGQAFITRMLSSTTSCLTDQAVWQKGFLICRQPHALQPRPF